MFILKILCDVLRFRPFVLDIILNLLKNNNLHLLNLNLNSKFLVKDNAQLILDLFIFWLIGGKR